MSRVAGDRSDGAGVGDLEEQRRFLLRSLEDLEREREAGDIEESDYATLRDDYTARAAAVLRAIERARRPRARSRPRPASQDGAPGGPAEPPAKPPRRREPAAPAPARRLGRPSSSRRVAITVIGALLVAGGAGVGVAAFSGTRVAGSGSSGAPATPAQTLGKAHELDTQGKAADALKLYDAVLRQEPANVEALTYKGWLLARAGLTDMAVTALDQAVAADAGYPDAHFFRGMVLYQFRHDPAAAVPEFEAFLAHNPPPGAVAAVQDVLDRARRDLAGGSPPTTAGGAPPTTAGK